MEDKAPALRFTPPALLKGILTAMLVGLMTGVVAAIVLTR